MKAKILLLFLLYVSACAQNDSLYSGRACKIILTYGFEAEGTITKTGKDTVWLRTKYKELGIPVRDIKYVLNPDADLSDMEKDEEIVTVKNGADTSRECDVYLNSQSFLKDVQLVYVSDSTVTAVKDGRDRQIQTADIRKIAFKPPAPFWNGAAVGGGFGFLLGIIFYVSLANSEGEYKITNGNFGDAFLIGLAFAIPPGLVGGLVALVGSKDKEYYFDSGMTKKKAKRIRYLIKKHS